MKKFLALSFLFSFICLSASAQLSRTNPRLFRHGIAPNAIPATGNENIDFSKVSYLKNSASDPSYGDTVGYTWYDLQTNSSMQNRIYQDAQGNIQVVWTKAVDTIRDPGNALRGIGYNYYDAVTQQWIPGDSNNTAFGLAEKRVGWPSIANTDGSDEHIFAHTSRLYNSIKGTSAVTAVDIAPSLTAGNLFYHSYGEGNTIYVLYDNGISLAFAKSDDGGNTWPIADVILDSVYGPSLNSTIVPDGYDLHTKGDSLAIITGGYAAYAGVEPNDVVLYLSSDRGVTFTRTVIHDFDTINAVLDTATGGRICETPHGDVRVMIGEDGRIHCTGSVVGLRTLAGTQNADVWFPLTRGIWYWNSDMATSFDLNDSTDYSNHVIVDSISDGFTLGTYPDDPANQGNYVAGSFAHSNIAEDSKGDLYITFDGVCAGSDANVFNDGRWRRDIYVMKSGDGGTSWIDAQSIALLLNANDLTDGTAGEEAYVVTPKRVQNYELLMFFQYDSWAGPTLTDALPILEQNKMAVQLIDFRIRSIEEETEVNSLRLVPNPSEGFISMNFDSQSIGETSVIVTNLLGQVVHAVKVKIDNRKNSIPLDLNLKSGIYLVTVGTGKGKFTQKLVIE